MKKARRRLDRMKLFLGLLLTVFLVPQVASAQNFDFMDGCNWADPRDNYVTGILVMSGTKAGDSTTKHKNKAAQLAGYAKNRGMNSIRIPCNPQTISNNGQWSRFQNRVTGINSKSVNILICHWDGGGRNKDGKLDNQRDWETMWDTIDAKYRSWSRVYFSPFNEPFGLSTSQLKNLFDNDFIDEVSKGDSKILINGKGFDDNVAEIARFPAFNKCGFSQHIYPWYYNRYSNTQSGWRDEVRRRVGSSYYRRTVITEFGNQPGSRNYLDGTSSAPGQVKFVRGICDAARNSNMGLMWWPGWRDGDSFRMWSNTNSNTMQNETLDNILRWGFDR